MLKLRRSGGLLKTGNIEHSTTKGESRLQIGAPPDEPSPHGEPIALRKEADCKSALRPTDPRL